MSVAIFLTMRMPRPPIGRSSAGSETSGSACMSGSYAAPSSEIVSFTPPGEQTISMSKDEAPECFAMLDAISSRNPLAEATPSCEEGNERDARSRR